MTPAQILAIPVDQYGRLFRSRAELRERYHELLKIWHPDGNVSPEATAVTAHINTLYAAAKRDAEAGEWRQASSVVVLLSDRKVVRYGYLAFRELEHAGLYIGRHSILTIARAGCADLVDRARHIINALPPAPAGNRVEFEQLLPKLTYEISWAGRPGYIQGIPTDLIRLRDLISAKGAMDPKHVAWVMSGLYNLACYLDWAGIIHLGLDPDSIWISPKNHSVHPLGGWEFSALRGQKPLAASGLAASVLGLALKAHPTNERHHLVLARAIGRTLLGDPSGASLSSRHDLPVPFRRWFQFPPTGDDPRAEYKAWDGCLHESFGARRFVELSINRSDIYGG